MRETRAGDFANEERASDAERVRSMANRLLSSGFLEGSDFERPPVDEPGWIGRYKLEGELARGGMGVVYAAQDEELARPVAIKRPSVGLSPEGFERFQREARASAGLRHDHIVTTYEVGHDERGPYLVMERLEGPSLADVLASGPLEPRAAARLAAQIARALAHAHAAGILHRDVKPGNVLLRDADPASSDAVLGDFGLAKPLSERGGPTSDGQLVGSPAYMAPEQLRAEPLDGRADVYGLGVTLFELLTATLPHGAASVVERASGEAPPPSPRALRDAVPESLAAVCLRCLHHHPRDRYPDARALDADLTRFLQGEAVEARPLAWPARAARWASRRRSSLAVALLVAIALGALGRAWQERRASEARERTALLVDQVEELADRHVGPSNPLLRAEVIRQARVALEHAPSKVERTRLGSALIGVGANDEARALLEESIRAFPPGYTELELLHRLEEREQGRSPGVSRAQRRALEIARARGEGSHPRHPFLAWARARQALERDDLEGAIRAYSVAIERGLEGLRLDRAVLSKRKGDFEAAFRDLKLMHDVDPRHPWPSYQLGLLEVERGDTTQALAYLDLALALDPTLLPARAERGLLYVHLGHVGKGRADLLRVLREDPRGERAPGATWQAATALALAPLGRALDARLFGHGPAQVSER